MFSSRSLLMRMAPGGLATAAISRMRGRTRCHLQRGHPLTGRARQRKYLTLVRVRLRGARPLTTLGDGREGRSPKALRRFRWKMETWNKLESACERLWILQLGEVRRDFLVEF